jgi:hypothetical protein
MANATIKYSKSESVLIELTPKDIEQAVRVYLSSRLDIPENAEFTFNVSSWENFEGLMIRWTEGPETVVEEIS